MTKLFVPGVALCLVGALVTSACSTANSKQLDAGQRISERGDEIANRGHTWSEGRRDQLQGQKLVKRSVKQVSDGENDLKKAQAAITKAERKIEVAHANRANGELLVSSGTLKMQKAEADYAAIRNRPSAMAPQ